MEAGTSPAIYPPPPRTLPAVYHPEQVATDYGQAPEGYEFDRYGVRVGVSVRTAPRDMSSTGTGAAH